MRRAAVALLSCFAAACGSSASPPAKQPPTEEQRLRAVAQEVTASSDAGQVCNTLVTAHFIQAVYAGDRTACADSQDTGGKATVESVAIHGATADVAIRTDKGVTGTLAFAREGRRWKLDDFETDYLRASFLAGIDNAQTGAVAEPSVRTCVRKQVTKLPDKTVRAYILAALRKDPQAKRAMLSLVAGCPDQMATYVTNEIVDGVGGPPRYQRCLRRWITKLLRESKVSIAALADVDSPAGKSAVKALVLGAGAYCTIS